MSTQVLLSPTPSGERLSKLLKAPEMDPILLAAANLYLAKKSVPEIASELGIREDRAAQILAKEEVQKYIEQCILSQGFLNPLKSLEIVEGVIVDLLSKGAASGEYTAKDLLDWMKELRALREGLTPKKAAPQVAVQVNNINKLYEDLQ
jgi:hypothetical protein